MSKERAAQVTALHDDLARQLFESGRVVEFGFALHDHLYLPDDLPEAERERCRECFMMGAQHFYSTILSALEGGAGPTPNDLRRMQMAHDELDTFLQNFKQRHGVGDDLYPHPPVGTKQ